MENFTWMPRRDVQIEYPGGNEIISSAENGFEQRRARSTFNRRTLTFTYGFREQETITLIEAFYLARKGPIEAFNWVDPVLSETIKVRFVPGTFRKGFLGNNKWSLSFQLIEVR
jgi:phage-related protein